MFAFALLKELYERVQIIPDLVHQFLPEGASFGDDRIFPGHINLPSVLQACK
jgi:hypothetical protein